MQVAWCNVNSSCLTPSWIMQSDMFLYFCDSWQHSKGKKKVLASQTINMKQYASALPTQTDIKLRLKPASRKVVAVSLQFTLSCVFLREGKATWVVHNTQEKCLLTAWCLTPRQPGRSHPGKTRVTKSNMLFTTHITLFLKRGGRKMKLNESVRQKLNRQKSWQKTKHAKWKSYLLQFF